MYAQMKRKKKSPKQVKKKKIKEEKWTLKLKQVLKNWIFETHDLIGVQIKKGYFTSSWDSLFFFLFVFKGYMIQNKKSFEINSKDFFK